MLPLPLLRITALPHEDLDPLVSSQATDILDRLAAVRDEVEALAPTLGEALFAAAGPPDPDSGAAQARARLAVVALRRSVFNRRPLAAADLESARPRLPPDLAARLETYRRLRRELEDLESRYEQAFTAELTASREAFLRVISTPFFQGAVRLVSRGLLERLRSLGDPSAWRHDERLAASRLVAYLARTVTKTSPNGLFCATAPAAWARDGHEPEIAGENRFAPLDVLLNVTEARKVASCLGADPGVWPALTPRVNPTLGEDGGDWIFWRPFSIRHEHDENLLRRLERHPVAEIFLELAGTGRLPLPRLLDEAARITGATPEELAPFFVRLAEGGLLTGEIEMPYVCRRPLAFVAEKVREAGGEPAWLSEAEAVEAGVDELGELPPGPRIAAMDDLEERFAALPHRRPLVRDELFRLDAASRLAVTLPAGMLEELRTAVGGYARFFGALYPGVVLRRNLSKPFLREFDADRPINLLDVYRRVEIRDPSGHRPSAFEGAGSASNAALERTREIFAGWAHQAAERGRDEVEIRDADWELLADGAPEPPWAAGVLFQVAAASRADLAADRYRLVLSDLFTGVGVALARFAHLHGRGASGPDNPSIVPLRGNPVVRELSRACRPFVRDGAILAEVTFNHWGRTSNAGLRQPFLEHEIELIGERGSPGATVIPLRELTLTWVSEQERFRLDWTREGVEVVPVISSGVAPMGFVSLLAGIGRQAIQPVSYVPGFEAETIRCWPRFTCGRVVVFRRRWILPPGTAPEAPAGAGTPDRHLRDFFARVDTFRRREGLPRHLFVHSSRERKPFYVDLASPLLVDLLRRLLTPARGEEPPSLYATEMLPGPGELWVRDGRGRYATEFLVQMGG